MSAKIISIARHLRLINEQDEAEIALKFYLMQIDRTSKEIEELLKIQEELIKKSSLVAVHKNRIDRTVETRRLIDVVV